MGSVELGRRWTVRVCGTLVLLVVLLCTNVVIDWKTQQMRGKDQLSAVIGHSVSLDQSLVVTQERSPELRPAPKLQAKFTPLNSSEINGLRLLVFFVGFARSGHSIVGSLLDSHPDVIIAHEYKILKDVWKGSGKTKGAVLSLVNETATPVHLVAGGVRRGARRATHWTRLEVGRGGFVG